MDKMMLLLSIMATWQFRRKHFNW